MDLSPLLTGGGAAGLVLAVGYIGRLALDAWREKRTAPREQATASVSDAAAANAVLVQSLDALRAENQRMARKIKHLEDEAQAKDAKIGELQQALSSAQRQIDAIASDLAALKAHK